MAQFTVAGRREGGAAGEALIMWSFSLSEVFYKRVRGAAAPWSHCDQKPRVKKLAFSRGCLPKEINGPVGQRSHV